MNAPTQTSLAYPGRPVARFLPNPKAKLLDQVKEVCRLLHYSRPIYTHVMQKPGLGVRSPLDG